MVEHLTVNQNAAGSSPVSTVKFFIFANWNIILDKMTITLFLYISDNFLSILHFNILLLLLSWLGIAFSDNFIESFFFLELVYLSLVIFSNLINTLINFFLLDLFLIFILFFSICDSILGLILVLITFNINKNIEIKNYHFLYG